MIQVTHTEIPVATITCDESPFHITFLRTRTPGMWFRLDEEPSEGNGSSMTIVSELEMDEELIKATKLGNQARTSKGSKSA